MRGKAYLAALVTVLIVPLLWVQSFRFAKRHQDDDARATGKIVVGIVGGLVLFGVGALWLTDYESGAIDGFYDTLEAKMATHTGESDYQFALDSAAIAASNADKAAAKRDEAAAAGDDEAAARWQSSYDTAKGEEAEFRSDAQALAPNHALFNQVNATVQARNDAAGRSLLAGSPILADGPREQALAAYDLKDRVTDDLARELNWMLWPSLIGIFYAPIIFALGSVLRSSWVPSDTVGFKPYPHKAAGWFLLMGAGGVPSVFFAAWALKDLQARSTEGQISL